jgi:hypothetical protein
MEGIPQYLADAIRKAIQEKTTYTEYLQGEMTAELKETLKQRHLLVVRHPRDKDKFKIFVPVKYRVKYR